MSRRVVAGFAVAILLAALSFADLVLFSKYGWAPVHPAVALFGDLAAVCIAVVAAVAFTVETRARRRT